MYELIQIINCVDCQKYKTINASQEAHQENNLTAGSLQYVHFMFCYSASWNAIINNWVKMATNILLDYGYWPRKFCSMRSKFSIAHNLSVYLSKFKRIYKTLRLRRVNFDGDCILDLRLKVKQWILLYLARKRNKN